MPAKVDRALAVERLKAAVEHWQVLVAEFRRPLDCLRRIDVVDDLGDLLLAVADSLERFRDRVVDDLDHAAADQLLVLDQRKLRLHACRVAVHHEPDRAGWRDHRDLAVAIAVLLPDRVGLVPRRFGRSPQVRLDALCGDLLARIPVHPNHLEEGLAVVPEALERAAHLGDLRTGEVSLAAHRGRDRSGDGPAAIRVVRHAHGHQHCAKIGEA